MDEKTKANRFHMNAQLGMEPMKLASTLWFSVQMTCTRVSIVPPQIKWQGQRTEHAGKCATAISWHSRRFLSHSHEPKKEREGSYREHNH